MAGSVLGSVAGAVVSSALSGGGGGSTATQSSRPTMPGWLSTDWQDLIKQAQTASSAPFQAYTGQSTAPLSADESSAFNIIRNMQGQSAPIFASSQNTLQDVLNRAMNGPSATELQNLENPYIKDVLEQQNLLTLQNYDRTQQGIKSNAALSGAFGGSGQYIQQALARKNLDQQLAMNNATGLSNAYNQAMSQYNLNTGTLGQTAIGQANLATQLQGITSNDASMLANAGATQRGINQAQDTFNYNEFMRQIQDPQQKASFLSNIMAQASPQYTGAVSQTTQPAANPFNSLIGGGIAGSQLGGALQSAYSGSNLANGISSLFAGNGFSNGWGLNSAIGSMISASPAIFKKGGLVKKYAKGGLVKGYDSGGLIYDLANNPSLATDTGKLFPGLSSLYKYLEPALHPETITADSFGDPVAEHAAAVRQQEMTTGNSPAQRPDLINRLAPNANVPPSLNYSLDPNAPPSTLEQILASGVPPVNDTTSMSDASVPAEGLGTGDASSMLDKLINQSIKDKIAESSKPKSFMDEANTPLLAMGLAMMGSNSPHFGAAMLEGYKAFDAAKKGEEADKDKKLNDLLSLAAYQRKIKSSDIEDSLKAAQAKYYGARAAGNGGIGGLTKNQQLVHLDKLRAQGKAAIDTQVKMGQLSPDQEKMARAANEANAQKQFKADMEALGVSPSISGTETQESLGKPGSSRDNPIPVATRDELEALPAETWVKLPNGNITTRK